MEDYVKLYHWYHRSTIRIIRLGILGIIILLATVFVTNFKLEKIALFFLAWYVLLVIFYRYKIALKRPEIPLSKNTGDVYASFTLAALDALFFEDTTSGVIKHVVSLPVIQFIMHKANIMHNELPAVDFLKDELVKEAVEITKKMNGTYVTPIDLFAAYILLTEPKTKLLFKKELKEDEFMHIIFWAHTAFPQEEHGISHKVVFSGEGIGEEWVSGWTFETKKYIQDLTAQVLSQPPVCVGRKQEFDELVEILSKDTKNSILLIGEPGIGKTTLVHELVFESFQGKLEGTLYHKRFYELMVGALLAGVKDNGELEARLQNIFAELTHAENVILFIPEIQNITGASTFKIDLTGALLPYLQNGQIRIIATATPGEYKNYIEPLVTFKDVFEAVSLEEPNHDNAIAMVLTKAGDIETRHGITFTYTAITTAVTLSQRYLHDRALPGTAIDVLITAASKAGYQTVPGKAAQSNIKIIDEEHIVKIVEEQTHIAVAAPSDKEKDLLLHFEEKMHERVINQDEAVHDIAQAVRRFRSGLSVGTRPISFLFLGPTGVGKTETAKALADLYFGGEQRMIRLDMSEYQTKDSLNRLLGAPAGEGSEKGELTEKIHDHPYSLVLLDEFEKAYTDILNLFLQVLDDGRLTDNKGKTVSFSSAIIIATSNAGAEFIREEIQKGTAMDKTFHEKLLNYLESKGLFKPELLNRFDGIIVFKPIEQNQAISITKLLLTEVAKKLDEQDITVTFDDRLIYKVSHEGFDQEFGARPLRRFIQENVEDFLAQKLLEGTVKRGDKITLSVDDKGNITIL